MKKSFKNWLENFVLISQHKNSKLGNKSFIDKKYQNEGAIRYKNGTYAEIELAEYKDWNYESILNRGLKLVNFLYERWGIIIGNREKELKKEFLGLNYRKEREREKINQLFLVKD